VVWWRDSSTNIILFPRSTMYLLWFAGLFCVGVVNAGSGGLAASFSGAGQLVQTPDLRPSNGNAWEGFSIALWARSEFPSPDGMTFDFINRSGGQLWAGHAAVAGAGFVGPYTFEYV
jgi:hypothetical protein